MAEKTDYIIKKTEKGPLQRFKNQNLLLKKFGELGLKVYRAITGRRTVDELKKDLALSDEMFYPVIDYMKETEMVELVPTGAEEAMEKPAAVKAPKKPAKKEKAEEKVPEEMEEELPRPEEEVEEKKEEEIQREKEAEEEKEEGFFEEIEPIKPVEKEVEKKAAKEETEEEAEKAEEIEKEETTEEGVETEKEEAEEEREEEEIEGPKEEIGAEEGELPFEETEEEESPVEKTIRKKYGDIGIQVYNLIDGQRTAEEIMKEVGISEPKLIEILDFLDKEGIIKLEYPGGKKEKKEETIAAGKEEIKEEGFAPILETEKEGMPKETVTIPNPIEVPVKLQMDVIKSVQISANVLIKFKDEGKRVLGAIDGETDVVAIAIKLEIPLYRVYEILNYLVENAVITLKPMVRDAVKKRYGDDAFTIYKKYGREGLMLYELIGKDLSFKEMINRTTTDKQKALEMFLFIHEVLGIELPLDKEMLAKQIGL